MLRFQQFVRCTRLASNVTPKRFIQDIKFPGAPTSQYTEELVVDRDWPVLATYRVTDKEGNVLNSAQEPKVSVFD
jgi:hypothetical protein